MRQARRGHATGLFLAVRENPTLDVEDALLDEKLPSGDEAETFLRGSCVILARELRRRRGWQVVWLLADDADPDETPRDFRDLVHAYCVPAPGLLADVRGISDDDREFLAPFEDFFDYPGVRVDAPSDDVVDDMLRRAVHPDALARSEADAAAFVDAHASWFATREAASPDERS